MARNVSPGWMIRTLMLGAVLSLVPLGALAQVFCEEPGGGDFDGDGWSDVEECFGINVRPPLTVQDESGARVDFIPSCNGSGLPRAFCVEPTERDLFVILVRQVPSQLPADLFELTNKPTSQGGLGVTTHEVFGADPAGDRVVGVGSDQNALRFVEDPDPEGSKLGFGNYGTPNDLDRGTLWPVRITNFVAGVCGTNPCVSDQGASGVAEVSEQLLKWVANHEAGHMMKLTNQYNKRFGGYHLKAGTGVVMEQFVSYNTRKKAPRTTTFFIPIGYADQSLADAVLAEP